MFSIEMLPAAHGDCLLVTYGEPSAPRRVLIDGGTASTFQHLRPRIEALPRKQRHFELLIVTHIDSDHIDGVLELLRAKLHVTFGDIWFNGWPQLVPPASELLGPRQGDMLGNLLSMRDDLPWNEAFQRKTVVVPDSGELPVRELPGGLRLTLLSPTWKELMALDTLWIKESFRQGRIPGESPELLVGRWPERFLERADAPFVRDSSAANGSSIAVLAEYQDKRCLLSGDAFADTLLSSFSRLANMQGKLRLDAFKLPHHGSQANVSAELIQAVECPRYLISTNGNIFGHPDLEAIARVLRNSAGQVALCFNYDTAATRKWLAAEILKELPSSRYRAVFPASAEGGLRVEL